MNARPEKEVFNDLGNLCRQPGYIHAIAYFCFRDNIVKFGDTLNANDLAELSRKESLIRTEISTLIGLMVRGDIDFTLPRPGTLQGYIDRTEALLLELHKSMTVSWFSGLTPEKIKEGFNPFSSAEAMREPIFYGGESAYVFQYRDLAPRKYAKDDDWLRANKGFSIAVAVTVAEAICRLQNTRLMETRDSMQRLPPDQWTILPGFMFTPEEIAASAGLDEGVVDTIVRAFALPNGLRNVGFTALNEFNETNAQPVIPCGENQFILLQQYSLLEALYETPFYWINSDRAYAGKAGANRGAFAEEFARERLEHVFGKERVHTNVDIYESKSNRIGEIDVLVLFGDRAIVLQAKSKRLTLEARKGNDLRIKDDFKKGIQDSYDQGLLCAKALEQPAAYTFLASGSTELSIPALTEIYILCAVSDHYPALAFQARQFLKSQATERIAPPYVMDVFTLDVMTEMLASPLRLLSYIGRRCRYDDRIMAGHELTILSDHLKRNLWINKKFDMVTLDDSIAIDLDCAMMVRREGLPGEDTPDGILTRLSHTAVGRLITAIEHAPVPSMLSLGFMLLTLSEDCINDVSKGFEHISRTAKRDGKHHDLSILVREGNTGLTIHCNDKPSSVAIHGLQLHCEKRKYAEKAASWFGVCLSAASGTPRFGASLVYEWKQDERMESLTRRMGTPHKSISDALKKPLRAKKLGRNDPCPCGSGKKYKKCCLGPA